MIETDLPPHTDGPAKPEDTNDFDVVMEDHRWTQALLGVNSDGEILARACRLAVNDALIRETGNGLAGTICVLCTDDAAVRRLNARFRQQDKATNVLSFPGAPQMGHLGDIALAYETCAREAAARALPIGHHFAHLIVHGLLHLMGYDHINMHDAARMETLEIAILQTLSIANPYADSEPIGITDTSGE
ncbi:MAG: rRNA maturation RNase YbeY [Pseudomonadota bacterium]